MYMKVYKSECACACMCVCMDICIYEEGFVVSVY